MNYTPREIAQMVRRKLMARSGAERRWAMRQFQFGMGLTFNYLT
jgi:hypothetical protein